MLLIYWVDFDQICHEVWCSSIIFQMVLVCCISSLYGLKIDFEVKNEEFLSETTRSRAMIFGM